MKKPKAIWICDADMIGTITINTIDNDAPYKCLMCEREKCDAVKYVPAVKK